MQPYEYSLYIGREIIGLWNTHGITYSPGFSSPRYPFFNGAIIRHCAPFNFGTERFLFHGCNLGAKAAFVPWIDNNISAYLTSEDRIAVSYGFSGCYMAKYRISGKCYISHIQSGSGDCKHIWNSLCLNHRQEVEVLALFRPTDNRDAISAFMQSQERRGIRCTIGGVIMPDNSCHSVLVNVATHLPLYMTEATGTFPFLITEKFKRIRETDE